MEIAANRSIKIQNPISVLRIYTRYPEFPLQPVNPDFPRQTCRLWTDIRSPDIDFCAVAAESFSGPTAATAVNHYTDRSCRKKPKSLFSSIKVGKREELREEKQTTERVEVKSTLYFKKKND